MQAKTRSRRTTMRYRLATIIASAFIIAPLAAAPTFAAGGGGGGSDVPSCPKGKVYDQATKKCVAQSRGAVDDDSLYATGRKLVTEGDFEEAIKVLSLAENKSDPRILNYLGYSHRKAGRVLVGLGYYEEALRIDPNYTLVREYLGEAHLMLGDVASARYQLLEIEKRCGTGCEEYKELAKQIDSYQG
jgi:tetratricopeptide (TPR) repeat protein